MKILGVDYGTKRIGLALGDTESSLVLPLRSVEVAGGSDAVGVVAAVAEEEGVGEIVIGLPRPLGGSRDRSSMERQVLGFVDLLREASPIPVQVEDERLTSALAESLRREAGAGRQEIDKDAVAATVLLESYLQRRQSDVGGQEEGGP